MAPLRMIFLHAGLWIALLSVCLPAQAQERYVYWTGATADRQGLILRGSLDDLRIDTVYRASEVYPQGLAVDTVRQKLYWTGNVVEGEPGEMAIRQANLDGSDVEVLLGGIICGTGSLTDIAVDYVHERLYWAYFGDCTAIDLMCVDLDGSDFEFDLLKGPGILEFPTHIALDPSAQKLYWSDQSSSPTRGVTIRRANFDGTGVEAFINEPAGGIALDLTVGKLYWATSGRIMRADLADGSNPEEVIAGVGPSDLVLDVRGGMIYWSDLTTGAIRRARLDGTGVEDVFTDVFPNLAAPNRFALSFENSIAVSVDRPEQPETGYRLWPNHPNPFSLTTTIRYEVPQKGYVRLAVYDLLGREVALLVNGVQAGGVQEVVFNAAGLPGGIYLYRLETAGRIQTWQMMLLK